MLRATRDGPVWMAFVIFDHHLIGTLAVFGYHLSSFIVIYNSDQYIDCTGTLSINFM